jgi:hypothetical protein
LALGLLLALAVGLSQAQGPGPENGLQPKGANSPVGMEGAVTGDIPIQGRLTGTNGNPVPDGVYTITFRLYDAAVNGTLLCEDTDHPPVTNGLFTTLMGYCTADDINGQELWLGIQVEGDEEMQPRQQIASVPYARSLRPGANISGTVSGDAIVHAENSATSGRALRGYATAATGTNYGVVGKSWSPTGYGGYFTNEGGGTALYAGGVVSVAVNAGAAKPISVGERYRDNAIVAWAKCSGGVPGAIQAEFGISAVDHYNTGCYKIYLDISAAEAASLIPMAIAEIDSAPVGAGAIRIVSINQLQPNIFNVYINDGNGNLVDNDFVFMVTAR